MITSLTMTADSGMVYAYAVVRLLWDSFPSLKDPYGLSGDLNGQVYSDGLL